MKVSCIIPVYNTSRYLRYCVDSVLRQSYDDYEIVLVNDCSTDNSAEICRAYADDYPDKVVFIDKEQNEGVDKARFTGLTYVIEKNRMGGVIFIDSDDYISKRALEFLVEEMNRVQADVVQMRCMRVWGSFLKKKLFSGMPTGVFAQPELFEKYYISFFGVNIFDINMCAKLYSVETIARAQLSPTGFRMGEDLMFNLRLFPSFRLVSVIDYPGYNYRVGGLTSRYNPCLWGDLKEQYMMKRAEAISHNYKKALRSLSVELKNILLSAIVQRLIYLKEPETQICEWISAELSDKELWHDILEMAPNEKDPIYRKIAEGDVHAILVEAQKRVRASRVRRMVKKILSVIIR